jgi:fatty-acyl-CoA synthase
MPWRERATNRSWLRAIELTAPIAQEKWRTFPSVIEELSDRFGEKTALISEHENFTFRTLAERSNRYARWAMVQNLGHGARSGPD